jgi:ribosome-binding protein aMBF1 (putative translation factor)
MGQTPEQQFGAAGLPLNWIFIRLHWMKNTVKRIEKRPGSSGHPAQATDRHVLTAAQCRAARALLDWSRKDLAERTNISIGTVFAFESAAADTKTSTVLKLQKAFAQAGIEFIDEGDGKGEGVRFKSAKGKR